MIESKNRNKKDIPQPLKIFFGWHVVLLLLLGIALGIMAYISFRGH